MVTERAQSAIDKLASERERLLAWVEAVLENDWEKMAPEGIWRAKDYVAHLASIDPLLVGLVRAFQRERARGAGGGGETRSFSIDDWNEEQILERRGRTSEELSAEMARNRTALNEALASLTDEQLDRTFHFGGDKSRSPRDIQVGEFLRGLVYHDRWHMEDARRAIDGEAEQPFGDEAFSTMLGTNRPTSA